MVKKGSTHAFQLLHGGGRGLGTSTLILRCLFLFSLFEWSVPFLCWMAVTILLLASILFYFVPLRYVILVWGKNGAACVWTVLHCLYVSGCDNNVTWLATPPLQESTSSPRGYVNPTTLRTMSYWISCHDLLQTDNWSVILSLSPSILSFHAKKSTNCDISVALREQ